MLLNLLAQTTQPSGLTIADIERWAALALAAIAAIGTVGTAFLAMCALLVAKANTVRIAAQHDRLEGQQQALNTVQMAMPAPQTVTVELPSQPASPSIGGSVRT